MADCSRVGVEFAQQFSKKKKIMGIFDEGCMGMYNAIVPDELLWDAGLFKERLSQSALYARMLTVSDEEARSVYEWLLAKGVQFRLGKDDSTELTESQVLQQCRMYIAAVRLADEFGCATIGIQYQQGLKDLVPASDLAEGLLNNVDRPPVYDERRYRISTKWMNARDWMALSPIICGDTWSSRRRRLCMICVGVGDTAETA
jgi:hypothetical protein